MQKKWNLLLVLFLLAATFSLSHSVAVAQGPVIDVTIESSGITWQAQGNNDAVHLTVNGPDGFHLDEQYAGSTATFNAGSGPDGPYNYELVTIPHIDEQVRAALASVTEENRYAVEQQLREAGKLIDPVVQSGTFYVLGGAIVDSDGDQLDPDKDIQHLDDVIINFSLCVGNDCVNGENFGFDTLRLKENNLRIHFDDTSNSASFPANDWRIVANDSTNGGSNYLAIEDATAGRQVFRVEAGARANALYVESDGDIGIGTSNPAVDVHMVTGNTPTLRLDQDGSSGFTPQVWDVAGNEANFFVRDVTNGSKLSFRIRPGAPESSIDVQSSGFVGIGDSSADANLDVESSSAAGTKVYINNTNGGDVDASLSFQLGGVDQYTLGVDDTDDTFKIGTGAALTTNPLSIDTSGNVTASGNVCDGANNCLHTVGGGGGSSPWTTSGSDIYYNSGNVGIGTTNPNSTLDVKSAAPTLYVTNSTSGSWNEDDVFGTLGFYSEDPTLATLPGLNAAIKAIHTRTGTGHTYADAGLGFYTLPNDPSTSLQERMRITHNGDVGIGTTTPDGPFEVEISGTELLQLSSNGNLRIGGTLTQNSDVNAKENFKPVDGQEVLTRLADVPITTWNYKADDPAVRHIGPMAQDFYAAFEVGEDERHIAPLDTSGVTLAAIQELNRMVQEKDDQITQLQEQNAALEARLEALEQLVESLAQK